ncbi:uncharacterized protein [Leptinotarsa decemlineata]|uniref:uncharacterized protein n=1 Tax=Leptinotarsa decemlineata TaxID=7539 RepID=UPI000C251E59|nr:uncharacterized protein LOC111516011 [Leptinotarsa decemlineata]
MRFFHYVILSSTAALIHCFPRAEEPIFPSPNIFNLFKNKENEEQRGTNPIDGITDAFKPFANAIGDNNGSMRNSPQIFFAVTHGVLMPSDTVMNAFINGFKALGNNPNFREGIQNIWSSISKLGSKPKED